MPHASLSRAFFASSLSLVCVTGANKKKAPSSGARRPRANKREPHFAQSTRGRPQTLYRPLPRCSRKEQTQRNTRSGVRVVVVVVVVVFLPNPRRSGRESGWPNILNEIFPHSKPRSPNRCFLLHLPYSMAAEGVLFFKAIPNPHPAMKFGKALKTARGAKDT